VEAVSEIEGAGGRLVVVTPQSVERAAAWRTEIGLGDTLVIADPKRTLYRALGALRPRPTWILRPRVLGAGMRAFLARERVSVTAGDDTLLLGVDLVVDAAGGIAYAHRARDAADRTPPAELIDVVLGLELPTGTAGGRL
jgi:AhpC/TSA antioxidant enzyme